MMKARYVVEIEFDEQMYSVESIGLHLQNCWGRGWETDSIHRINEDAAVSVPLEVFFVEHKDNLPHIIRLDHGEAELSDGGLIGLPNAATGTIRHSDKNGKTLEWRKIGDSGWQHWAGMFGKTRADFPSLFVKNQGEE